MRPFAMILDVKENELLKNHSTFRVGGPARYFVVVKDREEILEAVNFARQKSLPFFILGGGSNVLFGDEGYEGVVIKNQNSKIKIQNDNSKSKIIKIGAGTLLTQAVNFTANNGLSGLEWAVGIPGTVGGCVNGNCGAYGRSISDVVDSVEVLGPTISTDIVSRLYSKTECGFVYRGSKFKRTNNLARRVPSEVILEVALRLEKGDSEKIKGEVKKILDGRKGKVPTQPSAGSVFKNIRYLPATPGRSDDGRGQTSDIRCGVVIPEGKIKGGKIPVAYLIEECELKGKQIGGAQISPLHANFIVNTGGAKASDVLNLIKLCKEKVKEKFDIDLEEEIVII